MPDAIGASATRRPAPTRSASARASSKPTSVKTAIAARRGPRSEGKQVPDALADGAAVALRRIACAALGHDLVAGQRALFLRHRQALRFAAHAQLVDTDVVVLDTDLHDLGL